MKNQLTIGIMMACFVPFAGLAQSAREAVIAAEASFAAQATQLGTKAAFLANAAPGSLVADDGKLADALEVWQASPSRPGARLAWYPVLADAAQSKDLSYTTGPWNAFQNNRPQASGEYVTVWRKQSDGQLKVAVNMSIERIGTAPAPMAAVPAPRLPVAAGTPSTAPSYVVLDIDRKFAEAEALKPGATYQQYLSTEARLYRPGLSTMLGAAAAANMKNLDSGYQFTTTGGYLSAAGDLGYAVGTLHRASAGTKHPQENGSYLRIWRREAVAGWRIVLEVFNYTSSQAATADVSSPEGSRASSQSTIKAPQ